MFQTILNDSNRTAIMADLMDPMLDIAIQMFVFVLAIAIPITALRIMLRVWASFLGTGNLKEQKSASERKSERFAEAQLNQMPENMSWSPDKEIEDNISKTLDFIEGVDWK